MTLEEMEAAGRKASAIRHALKRLEEAEYVLRQVNKHVTSGQVWKPTLRLTNGDRWGPREVTIDVPIPGGYIQQWAIDAVRQAEREVIMAGGALP